jgi:hypothetical protein
MAMTRFLRSTGITPLHCLIDDTAIVQWSTWFTYFATPERRKAMSEAFGRGCHGFELWPELEMQAKASSSIRLASARSCPALPICTTFCRRAGSTR